MKRRNRMAAVLLIAVLVLATTVGAAPLPSAGNGALTETPEGAGNGALTGTPEGTGNGALTGTPGGAGNGALTETPEGAGNGALTGTPEGAGNGALTETPEGAGNGALTGTPEGTGNGALTGAGNEASADTPEESTNVALNSTGEMEVSDEAGLRAALTGSGTDAVITILNDIELTSPILIGGVRNIVLQGKVDDVTLTFSDAAGEIGKAANYSMFTLGADADVTVTVRNLILDGAQKARLFYLGASDKENRLVLENGAVLRNGHPKLAAGENGSAPPGGAVQLKDHAAFVMNGGKVTGNTSDRYGGGVYGWASSITVEINAGEISSNEGLYAGGIVLLGGDVELYLRGGEIRGNVQSGGNNPQGGGVFFQDGTIYMNGKTVFEDNVDEEGSILDIYLNTNTNHFYLEGPLTQDVVFGHIGFWHDNKEAPDFELAGAGSYTPAEGDLFHLKMKGDKAAFYMDTVNRIIRCDKLSNLKTITFHSNDGAVEETVTQRVPNGEQMKLRKNTFVSDASLFQGWNTQADGKGTDYADEELNTFSQDMDLYAQWKKAEKLVLKADKTEAVYGERITLTVEPVVEGWDYRWYRVSDTGVVPLSETGEILTLTEAADSGSYQVKVLDETGAAALASETVTVTIRKAKPILSIRADKEKMTGGGTVLLTVESSGLPDGAELAVSCSPSSCRPELQSDGRYRAELPDSAAEYTFTAHYAGDANHEANSASCRVTVTQKEDAGEDSGSGSGSGGGGNASSKPAAAKGAQTGDETSALPFALLIGALCGTVVCGYFLLHRRKEEKK